MGSESGFLFLWVIWRGAKPRTLRTIGSELGGKLLLSGRIPPSPHKQPCPSQGLPEFAPRSPAPPLERTGETSSSNVQYTAKTNEHDNNAVENKDSPRGSSDRSPACDSRPGEGLPRIHIHLRLPDLRPRPTHRRILSRRELHQPGAQDTGEPECSPGCQSPQRFS